MESLSKWTPVTAGHPEIIEERGDSGHLLCYDADCEHPQQFVGYYEPGIGWQVAHHFADFDREAPVTHYRSLPEPPEA